ncbi:esterase/lipase family protein [Frateuria hangzhouensis]|uniref:esterase/lipase family protein n=1 Tax=Frateuria hangzhouensis TaxID=2995589 RepID=UPI002260C4CE|nr:alpha/beta fold hydrolase [Frateuria sp. STR12]MCX7512956.1 alpha/beta fold hydrolase [Frateuria sp. STR12]
MPDQIILLHGLWMRGFALGLLHKRMAEAGFAVDRFDYMSVVSSQERIVERLHSRMQRHAPGPVHLVGHSLGGLLALQACREAADLPPGRIVCLGSPVKGSAAARGFAGFGQGGEALLGHNRALLEHGMECWEGAREVGMIAGRVPIGLGAMLAHMEGEHDGTVAVAETQLPGLADHCVVETSHTGLVLSADVARQTVHFLQHGHFAPAL